MSDFPLMKYMKDADGNTYEICDETARRMAETGGTGGNAEVTKESIEQALGYTPVNGEGGVVGQYAKSDGEGGIQWGELPVFEGDFEWTPSEDEEGPEIKAEDIVGLPEAINAALGEAKPGIVQEVIDALGTPVFGTIDADNNIILTGDLADGSYTVKYENADGSRTEVGKITVGDAPAYTNQIPISIDTDGSVFNGVGYKENVRVRSSGELQEFTPGTTPVFLTGLIYVEPGSIIRFKNCWIDPDGTSEEYGLAATNFSVSTYDPSSKTYGGSLANWSVVLSATQFTDVKADDAGNIVGFTMGSTYTREKYLRFVLAGNPEDAILTINEEIV